MRRRRSSWSKGPSRSPPIRTRANGPRTSWFPVPTSSGPSHADSRSRAVAYSSGDPWSAMSPVTSRTSGAGDIEQTCAITCAARATDSGRPPM